MSALFDPRRGQWWNAAPAKQFEAYYMTLRVHYGMPAAEAFAYAKAHGAQLGIGRPGAIVGLIAEALAGSS